MPHASTVDRRRPRSLYVSGGRSNTLTMIAMTAIYDLDCGRWSRRLVAAAGARAPRGCRLDVVVGGDGLGLVASGRAVYAIEGGPNAGLTTSRTVDRLIVR